MPAKLQKKAATPQGVKNVGTGGGERSEIQDTGWKKCKRFEVGKPTIKRGNKNRKGRGVGMNWSGERPKR